MSELQDGPEKLAAQNVDHFEWLALEALWAATKEPFMSLWEYWQNHPQIEDPAGEPGIVVGGNLQRAVLFRDNAAAFGSAEEPDPELLSQASGHLGKMAASLIHTTALFKTPPELWGNPVGDHIPTHLEIIDSVLVSVTEDADHISMDGAVYYDMLSGPHEAVQAMEGTPNREALVKNEEAVYAAACLATSTWVSVLGESPSMMVDPGGTPRSSGQNILNRRQDFDRHVPEILQAVAERRQSSLS